MTKTVEFMKKLKLPFTCFLTSLVYGLRLDDLERLSIDDLERLSIDEDLDLMEEEEGSRRAIKGLLRLFGGVIFIYCAICDV